MTIESWFAEAPATQRPLLHALRKLIHSSVPEVVEEFKWSRPVYSTPTGMFCYLQRSRNHVALGFHRGASLSDTAGMLEGTGKDMRHIKFAAGSKVNEPAVRKLIRQAAEQA